MRQFEIWADMVGLAVGTRGRGRCRAFLIPTDDPSDGYPAALALHHDGSRPHERARTELVYGEALRRARMRTASRIHLRAALAGFEQLGAEPWAERARAELRATGETTQARGFAWDTLTVQELQIAQLAARGASNPEIAGQLFLSRRTIEYHLHKVFTKLGLASRTELVSAKPGLVSSWMQMQPAIHRFGLMMSESTLSRHAGPIVAYCGCVFDRGHLALVFVFVSFNDAAVMVADPLYRVPNLAYAAAFSGLAIAACAAYDKQAHAAGTFGLVALCAAIVGTVNLGANMWFEGFAVPWLADVVPQVLTAQKTMFWKVGYLSSYTLFSIGWVLFGLASLRAGVFPRLISLAIVVGGIIGFLAARPRVRRRAGPGAAEPGDLDDQDSERRPHNCAADAGLICCSGANEGCGGNAAPRSNHTPSAAMARPRNPPRRKQSLVTGDTTYDDKDGDPDGERPVPED